MANGCGRGKIKRSGYTIKSGPSKGTRVSPTCVPDKGAPGKGPKTLPKPTPGALKGYSPSQPADRRRGILNRIARSDGCGEVTRRLNLIANYTKKSNPRDHKKYRSDIKYMQTESGVCELQIKAGEYHPSK